MSQAPSLAIAVVDGDNLAAVRANVSLKGTTRGLEILIASAPSSEALGTRLTELLSEAPSFFAGSDARVAFEGALPAGALACLEDVATRFALTIVEIGPVVAKRARTYAAVVRRPDARPSKLAEGTGPISEDAHVRRGSEPRTALPSLPAEDAPGDASAAPSDADPEAVALSDATPTEVELANTAPYAVAAITSAPAASAPAEAAPESAPVGAELAHAGAALPGEATVEAAVEAAPDEAAPVRIAPAEAAAIEAALALAVPIHTIAADAAQSHTAPGTADADVVAASIDDAVPADAVPAIDPAVTATAIEAAAAVMAAELVAAMPPGPRLVIGPVRSGVIVDHTGHVIVIGDVNPGAEVRAEGSIIILGRLRGVAHAAIGREAGCIIALSLQPQQLRIGRMVARAGDADRPSDSAEIAYATGETIVVERFLGRLPSGLAASM